MTTQKPAWAIKGVKHLIAVGSGKGGVGKSTTAVNLALALKQQGHQVGLVDADIYGPNQPTLLGKPERAKVIPPKRFQPLERHGLQVMSIGYLVDQTTPMIWRGPMVSQALMQLVFDTEWQDLDILVVDLPPGTGDIQLTLSQKIPVTGAVFVTTPQPLAAEDVAKGIAMFQKVNIPLIGLIENMATHTCTACGHQDPIFGTGAGEQLAKHFNIPLLASIPLTTTLRVLSDQGQPIVTAQPDHPLTQTYTHIATQVAEFLSFVRS